LGRGWGLCRLGMIRGWVSRGALVCRGGFGGVCIKVLLGVGVGSTHQVGGVGVWGAFAGRGRVGGACWLGWGVVGGVGWRPFGGGRVQGKSVGGPAAPGCWRLVMVFCGVLRFFGVFWGRGGGVVCVVCG